MKEMISDQSILNAVKMLFAKIQETNHGLSKVELHGGRLVQLTVWTDDPSIGEMTKRLWAKIGAPADQANVELTIHNGTAYVKKRGG